MRPTYRIHRYTYVDETTKYVAKEGAHRTTPHAKKNNEPPRTSKGVPANTNHNHITPHIYSSIGPDRREIHGKKKNQHKRKRYGAATDKGETMKRRTSEAHQPRGNNGMASKYVNNAREDAKGTDHAHTHTHKQGRNEREDGDKSKEKQGMKPHTAPPANTHTLSL